MTASCAFEGIRQMQRSVKTFLSVGSVIFEATLEMTAVTSNFEGITGHQHFGVAERTSKADFDMEALAGLAAETLGARNWSL